MGEAGENDAYEEELLDYEEDEEKASDAVAAKASHETAKKYDRSHILINIFRFISLLTVLFRVCWRTFLVFPLNCPLAI